jgi:hypothetical protein
MKVVLALGLGLLASLAFFVSANVYAYAASFVAGMFAAWLVPDRSEAWSDSSSESSGHTRCGAPTKSSSGSKAAAIAAAG